MFSSFQERGAKQLRDAAAARDLLGGKVIRAHAAPPETAAEFVTASLDVIRENFGSGPIDVYETKLDAPIGETEYRRVRFNLSRDHFRAIAKVAFHYFLWMCPWIGGDESEFDGIRGFVSNGDGDEHAFLQRHECLVDRAGVKDGCSSRLPHVCGPRQRRRAARDASFLLPARWAGVPKLRCSSWRQARGDACRLAARTHRALPRGHSWPCRRASRVDPTVRIVSFAWVGRAGLTASLQSSIQGWAGR